MCARFSSFRRIPFGFVYNIFLASSENILLPGNGRNVLSLNGSTTQHSVYGTDVINRPFPTTYKLEVTYRTEMGQIHFYL
mmetsp:Transcript_15005/g.34789  ORF Transcript_15005/g.34789 Transcript_15005/m.34789 type:complete len:80 (-) Transcript_15005:796-1035(-)